LPIDTLPGGGLVPSRRPPSFTSNSHFTLELQSRLTDHTFNSEYLYTSQSVLSYILSLWQRRKLLATRALAGTKRNAQQRSRNSNSCRNKYAEHACREARADIIKINDLRLAIPRINEPFQRPATPATFKLYAKGVLGSQDNVKSLNQKFRDTEMQSVFEHTKKSLAANTDLSASMSIPSCGWTEREKKERGANENSRSESMEESGTGLTDDEVAQLLGEFQKTHPAIKLATQEDNRTIIVG
jgi:hypothetical protein